MTIEPTPPAQPSVTLSATSAPVIPPQPSEAVQIVGPGHAPPLTPGQAEQMAEVLLRAGVDPERVRQAAGEHGIVSDERTDAQRENDAAWGMDHHVVPSEYKIDYGDAGRNMAPEMLAAANQSATEWLASMQAMPGEGAFIVQRAMEVGRELAGKPVAERHAWALKQRAEFETRFGPESASEQIRLAAYALKVGGNHPFLDELRKSGALHDQYIVRTLANVGRKIAGWAKGA